MKQRRRPGVPRPGSQATGNSEAKAEGARHLLALLPFLATVLMVCFFSFYYAETYMCSWSGWACPDGGYTKDKFSALACCKSPYFTDLFNQLQESGGAGEAYKLSPPFYVKDVSSPTPTPTAAPTPTSIRPTPDPFNPGPVVMAVTYQGHVAWSLFTGLYLIAWLMALGAGAWVIWEEASGGRRARALTVLAALAAGGVGASPALWVLKSYKLDIFTQLINTTVNRDVYNISDLEFGLDAAGLVLAAFLAAACSVTLLRRDDERLSASGLVAVQYGHLTLILYAGTVLLILATLRINALLHWSLDFLRPAPWLGGDAGQNALFIYKGVEGLVSNLVTSVGAFGTLLLAALYVPAALVLNARAALLAPERPQVHAGPEPYLAGKGLSFALPLPEQLLRLAVILAPFIAGPLGDWVSRLK